MKLHKDIFSWIIKNSIYSIIICGILIRILITILYQHITIYPDSEDYIDLANRLFPFNLNGYEGQRSPGYPLLLCLANRSEYLTIIIQLILGITSLVLFFKTIRLLGTENKKSLFFTLIITCYIPAIFFEFALLTETLTLLCITTIFYVLFKIIKAKDSQAYNYIILASLCIFLVLIKPFYIYIAILLFIVLLLYNIKNKSSISKTIFIAILPALVFIGWSAINKVNTGYFVSTTYYGFNLAQNCVSFAEKTTDEYSEIGKTYAKYREKNDRSDNELAMTIWQAYPELKEKSELSFPALSSRLYDYSITTIKLNPSAYMKQVAISWVDFWKTSLYWEYESFSVPHANSILKYICYAERIMLQLVKILFVLLIPVHIIRLLRKRELSPQLIISIVVLTTSVLQALVTYGTNSRFSFPFEMLIVTSVILDLFRYKTLLKQKS